VRIRNDRALSEHVINKSGWLLLIGLIPLAGSIVLLVFYVIDGGPGQKPVRTITEVRLLKGFSGRAVLQVGEQLGDPPSAGF
jgi:hypothetical protein